MTTHFHGSPITGGKGSLVAETAYRGAGAFVSYAHPRQIDLAFNVADTVCIDNGAFSKKNSGRETNWSGFYDFLEKYYDEDKLRFFVVPDDISGSEEINDILIKSIPKSFMNKAAPVWHMHESIDKLVRLASEWEYVCLGSSGEYFSLRSTKWKARMNDAFDAIIKNKCAAKIHGLRMLDGRVLGNYPLSQADSTNIAINVGKFKHKYPDITIECCRAQVHRSKWVNTDSVEYAYDQMISNGGSRESMMAMRCAILKGAIESVRPPNIFEWNSTNC